MPRSVLNDRFFESFSSSVLDFAQAESLPPACYVDPEFFEFEKETLFYKEWLCVGRESWVKEPGDYFCSKHVGEPLVITRTKSGEVAAMSAVCQHRGMLVAEGRGHARGLVCPYHHWFYSLSGELVAAPEMDRTCNFEKSNHNLARLKVEIWQGFVFVNFDAGALPLAPRLRALDDVVANYDLANLDGPPAPEPNRYNWNWKVMFENNNDGYHANRLHHGPLHDPVPSSLACFPELPDESAGYYRTNGSLHPDASFNPTLKALLPVFPKLTDAERNRHARPLLLADAERKESDDPAGGMRRASHNQAHKYRPRRPVHARLPQDFAQQSNAGARGHGAQRWRRGRHDFRIRRDHDVHGGEIRPFLAAGIPQQKYDVVQWVMWQMANQGPKFGEQGHFFRASQDPNNGDQPYANKRFADEVHRLYGVMNLGLFDKRYLAAGEYTIADMICYPWAVSWKMRKIDIEEFPNVKRWMAELDERPAVKKGMAVMSQRPPDSGTLTLMAATSICLPSS
jgi:nitrite reductase/ring-hydroxylating ferredoxin subunit